MGKLFGVVLTIIALASAYPIVTHMYVQPVDISTHGHAIDEQLADTMAEAGLAFVLAQLLLAFCVWKFSNRKEGAKVFHLRGGARLMVVAAFILGWHGGACVRCTWAESLGRGLFYGAQTGRSAGSGAGRTVCFLFSISRSGRKVRSASSRQN